MKGARFKSKNILIFRKMKVSDLMNAPETIDEKESVVSVARKMSKNQIGSLIVVKNNKIVGIVTESDILKNINKLSEKVSSVMSRSVIVVESNETLDEAARLMTKNKIKRLPVINSGKLVGIITATDILANSDELNEDFFFS